MITILFKDLRSEYSLSWIFVIPWIGLEELCVYTLSVWLPLVTTLVFMTLVFMTLELTMFVLSAVVLMVPVYAPIIFDLRPTRVGLSLDVVVLVFELDICISNQTAF